MGVALALVARHPVALVARHLVALALALALALVALVALVAMWVNKMPVLFAVVIAFPKHSPLRDQVLSIAVVYLLALLLRSIGLVAAGLALTVIAAEFPYRLLAWTVEFIKRP